MSLGAGFTLEDALELATFGTPAWNADGSRVGYLRFAAGSNRFVARPVDRIEETDLTLDAPGEDATELAEVSAFDWRPDNPDEVAVVRDGDLGIFDVDAGEFRELVAAADDHLVVAWSPDGSRLAAVAGETLWIHNVERGSSRELDSPVAERLDAVPVAWSDDGRFLATLTETDAGRLALSVYEPARLEGESGEETPPVAWERAPEPGDDWVADTFDWAGDRLVYAEDSTNGLARIYRVANPGEETGVGTPLCTEYDDRGLVPATLVGHEAGRAAIVSPRTGNYHIYVVDLDRRTATNEDGNDSGGSGFDGQGFDEQGFDEQGITQLTSGQFQARGDAVDEPVWNGTGDRLAYVTNESDPGERHLHVATVGEDGSPTVVEACTDVPGNAVYPAWAADGERIVCLRAGRTTPADVHVFDIETDAVRRISRSHPRSGAFEDLTEPEPVSFESSEDGEPVYGYLYAPPGTEAGDDLPAVVWTHGGPIRQMRRGFHHMRSYAVFNAFNRMLAARGYVVLELNYRGGIGYGREYELGIHHAVGRTDVQDCIDAAAYLKNRPEIGNRVGFWGLSYGGFLAAAVATRTDAFECAVNFAGVWDWADWMQYATAKHWGAGRRFLPIFGGHPDEDDPEVRARYERASPSTDAAELDTPFFALHGTADPNVPFAQMDQLVSQLVEHGREFEMAYYPDENHMFERSETWCDAMGRVVPFFDERLRDGGDS